MPLKIEETFELQAPIDRVWSYLTDPTQVVTCLPGAELTSVESETVFLGRVKVKVGPITAAYNGKVTITERDDAAHVVRMIGDGRESAGGGSAKMTMTSTLAALPSGGTEVHVTADLDIVGKLAQFGRGMIESVNKQMFKQFTDCVRTTLEVPAAVDGRAPSDVTRDRLPATITASHPSLANTYTLPVPNVPTATSQPVRLLPVLMRAVWESIAKFFSRFRRRAE